MEIAGRYGEHDIIIRCCTNGKWYTTTPMRGSGMLSCIHTGYHTCYDYLNIKEILKEALSDAHHRETQKHYFGKEEIKIIPKE